MCQRGESLACWAQRKNVVHRSQRATHLRHSYPKSVTVAPRLSPETKHALAAQGDVIAVWQLRDDERRSVRRAVRLGQWRQVTRRVVTSSHRSLDPSTMAWAAVLHGGPDAHLTGRNAMVLHGWRGDLAAPFDVAVPPDLHLRERPAWLRIRRIQQRPAVASQPPRLRIHEAIAHATRWARTDREAIYLLLSALQQRITTVRHILNLGGPNTARAGLSRSVLIEFRDGIQSLNELDFNGLCTRYGLPAPTRQVPVRDKRGKCRSIDVEFRVGTSVLRVEVEGVGHLDPDEWLADIDRHNDIVLADHSTYLRVASITIRTQPDPFMRRLVAAHSTLVAASR